VPFDAFTRPAFSNAVQFHLRNQYALSDFDGLHSTIIQ